MKPCPFDKLLDLLARLEEAKMSFDLEHSRDEAIMVRVVVPGEYWEIEVLKDGAIEIERYRSNGHIYDQRMLEHLFARYSADSPAATPEELRRDSEEFFRYLASGPGRQTQNREPA